MRYGSNMRWFWVGQKSLNSIMADFCDASVLEIVSVNSLEVSVIFIPEVSLKQEVVH